MPSPLLELTKHTIDFIPKPEGKYNHGTQMWEFSESAPIFAGTGKPSTYSGTTAGYNPRQADQDVDDTGT